MTGFFIKKYHVAIYDENKQFINRITKALKLWYDNRIVIETYTDPKHMFRAVNLCKAKNKPFDLAIFNSHEQTKQMILKHTCPTLPVLLFKDEDKLQKETSQFLL